MYHKSDKLSTQDKVITKRRRTKVGNQLKTVDFFVYLLGYFIHLFDELNIYHLDTMFDSLEQIISKLLEKCFGIPVVQE